MRLQGMARGLVLAAVVPMGSACGGGFPRLQSAVHVVHRGDSADLGVVIIQEGLQVRPEGVEDVTEPLLQSGFSGKWFYMQPGTYHLHVSFSFGALNELPLDVTIEPGGVYSLGEKDQQPVFDRVTGDDSRALEASLRATEYGNPAPLELGPGVQNPKGVSLFMFNGSWIAKLRHAHRSPTLAFQLHGCADNTGIGLQPQYLGMPSHVFSIPTQAADWRWNVLVPPFLASDTRTMSLARTAKENHSWTDAFAHSEPFQQVYRQRCWSLCDFMTDDAALVAWTHLEIESLPPEGSAYAKPLLRATELTVAWHGVWQFRDARVTPGGSSLLFAACPVGTESHWAPLSDIGGQKCRVGRVDLATRAISRVGEGTELAVSPDGHTAAVASARYPRREEIRLHPLSDRSARAATFKTVGLRPYELEWSPDGRYLAFAGEPADTDTQSTNVFVLRVSDGHVLPVTRVAQRGIDPDTRMWCEHPTWSPEGHLFFVCDWSLPYSRRPEIWGVTPPT